MRNPISADIKKWFEIYKSSDPINRAEAEEWITKAYHLRGEKTPRFVWVRGPSEAHAVNEICEKYSDEDYLEAIKKIQDTLEKGIQPRVEKSQYTNLGGGKNVSDVVYCQANYFEQKPEEFAKLSHKNVEEYITYSRIIQHAAIWHQWKNVVVAQEAPVKFAATLQEDNTVRLHCETGPAIAWGDGTKLYYLNNVRVPAWLVETAPEDLTAKHYLEEPNVEIRREIYRKIGWARLVKDFKGKLIDEWQPTLEEVEYIAERGKLVEPYRLWEVEIPLPDGEKEPARALQMFLTDKHGLRSEYFPFVDATINSAKDALYWSTKNRVPRGVKILLS